jgi:hypothetical protein
MMNIKKIIIKQRKKARKKFGKKLSERDQRRKGILKK